MSSFATATSHLVGAPDGIDVEVVWRVPGGLDESLFLLNCLPFIADDELLSGTAVNKTFNLLCKDDVLWGPRCRILWEGKYGLDKYTSLFHELNLTESGWKTCRISELKNILSKRGLKNHKFFLEKSEFIEACKRTCDGGKRLSDKHFASYWYSRIYGRRTQPTVKDITSCKWRMTFKQSFQEQMNTMQMPEIVGTFHADYTYSSEPRFNHGDLTWRFYDKNSIQVGQYPPLYFKRYPGFEWTCENEHVTFYSQKPDWAE